MSYHLCPLGDNVDLRWILDSLDSLCSGVCGVCVREARHGPHRRVSDPQSAGQVVSHVQPHHLPGHRPEKLLHKIQLFSGPEETQAF